MIRIIFGAALGVAAVIMAINFTEYVGSMLYPMPAPLDWADQAARAYGPGFSPPGARRLMAVGWFIQALVGAAVAVKIARNRVAALPPLAMGYLYSIGSVAMSGPGSRLFAAAVLLMPIAGGLVGIWLARLGSARARP